MTEERRDEVREHEFDGIQEFDNQLPRWWVGTFVLTILIGTYLWTTRYTFSSSPTLREIYEDDLAELKATQDAHGSKGPSDEEVLAWVKDEKESASGANVYATNCLACHGAAGQGGIGPNLTDAYWIHGGKPHQVAAAIAAGVPDKGMPTWKGVLSASDIRRVAAHVVSLKGTQPKDAKAPQGEKED